MARVAGITIQINAEGDSATKAIKELEAALKSAQSKIAILDHATNLLSKGLGLLKGVAGGAVGAVVSMAKEAAAAEKAERNLITALQLRGAKSSEIVPQLQAFNNAVQQGTGISGDALTAFQAQATALGVLPADLDNVTKAAIGWAQATGQDVATAGDAAIKVYNGNERALKQMGMATGDTSKNLAAMASNFGMAVEQGRSLEGQLTILSENFGDLEETLGGAITQSDNATQAIGAINETVVGLQKVFASPEGRAAVDQFFGIIAGLAADSIDAILGLIRIVDDVMIPNIKAGWADLQIMMGKDFIAEPLNEQAEAGKNAVLSQFEDLADKLRNIGEGRGGSVADAILPPVGQLEKNAQVKGQATGKAYSMALQNEINAAMPGIASVGLFGNNIVEQFRVATDQIGMISAASEEAQRQHAGKLVETQIGHMHSMFDAYRANLENNTKATAEAVAESERAAQQAMQKMQGYAMGVYGSMKSEIKAVASGQKSVGEGLLSLFGSVVEMIIDEGIQFLITKALEGAASKAFTANQIGAASGVAAANAYAATAAIPIVGPLLAPAAAAEAMGAVLGFMGPALAFAQGGLVTGGTPGRDSVPAMLMPGEYVLPTSIVDAIRAGRSPSAAVSGGAAGGLQQMIVAPMQTFAPPRNRAHTVRYYQNTVLPVVKDLNRRRLG